MNWLNKETQLVKVAFFLLFFQIYLDKLKFLRIFAVKNQF